MFVLSFSSSCSGSGNSLNVRFGVLLLHEYIAFRKLNRSTEIPSPIICCTIHKYLRTHCLRRTRKQVRLTWALNTALYVYEQWASFSIQTHTCNGMRYDYSIFHPPPVVLFSFFFFLFFFVSLLFSSLFYSIHSLATINAISQFYASYSNVCRIWVFVCRMLKRKKKKKLDINYSIYFLSLLAHIFNDHSLYTIVYLVCP